MIWAVLAYALVGLFAGGTLYEIDYFDDDEDAVLPCILLGTFWGVAVAVIAAGAIAIGVAYALSSVARFPAIAVRYVGGYLESRAERKRLPAARVVQR